jgi:hypothetical protein
MILSRHRKARRLIVHSSVVLVAVTAIACTAADEGGQAPSQGGHSGENDPFRGGATGLGGVPPVGSGGFSTGGSASATSASGGRTPQGGASSAAGLPPLSVGGSSPAAGAGGARSDAGGSPSSGGYTSGTGAAGNSSSGGSSSAGAPSVTVTPKIPEITGACPVFKTGTVTVGGLSGISLQVGEKKEGTGSLVFYWHGTGSSAGEVNLMVPAAVRQEILGGGGIIVSFGGSSGSGGDCSGTSTFSKDDMKVADLIAGCAVREHGIDPRRIYTTGCSAGGLQAGCMGALRSQYIAAVVPNSGGEVFRQTLSDPANTPAVMTMHGGSSDVVVVAFSTTSATLDAHMKEAGSYVINCNHGGGHCAAPAALYSAGWEFMKAHPYGVEPEPYASGIPATFPSYCKAY